MGNSTCVRGERFRGQHKGTPHHRRAPKTSEQRRPPIFRRQIGRTYGYGGAFGASSAQTIYRDLRHSRTQFTERERIEARRTRIIERGAREERERNRPRGLRAIGDMGDIPRNERHRERPAEAIPLPDRGYTSEEETDEEGWGIRVTSARPV